MDEKGLVFIKAHSLIINKTSFSATMQFEIYHFEGEYILKLSRHSLNI